MKRNQRFKAAIIGCGNIGYNFNKRFNIDFDSTHFMAYTNNINTELVAVCDSSFTTALNIAKENGIHAFDTVEEMLTEASPEIVSICTPDETHYSVLKQIVKHSNGSVKAIFCEKPLGISLKQGKEMVELCHKHNIVLAVNHLRRYDKFYNQVNLNMSTLVGVPQRVSCFYSGGIVTTGSHLVDLLHMMFGEIKTVSATGSTDQLHGVLTFKNGVVAHLIPCSPGYPIMEMNIIGTGGRLDTINKPFGEYDYRWYQPKENQHSIKYISSKQSSLLHKNLRRDFFNQAVTDIVKCIKSKKEPVSSGQVALESLETISAMVYSARIKGMRVRMPFNLDIKIKSKGGDMKR